MRSESIQNDTGDDDRHQKRIRAGHFWATRLIELHASLDVSSVRGERVDAARLHWHIVIERGKMTHELPARPTYHSTSFNLRRGQSDTTTSVVDEDTEDEVVWGPTLPVRNDVVPMFIQQITLRAKKYIESSDRTIDQVMYGKVHASRHTSTARIDA